MFNSDKLVPLNKRPLSPQGQTVYKLLLDRPGVLKKQQWTITNYVALLYGAIYAITPKVPSSALLGLLAALTVSILVYGVVMLLWIQNDLSQVRQQIDKVDSAIVPSIEYINLKMQKEDDPYWRGFEFTIALLGVVVIGGVIVIYHLCPQ